LLTGDKLSGFERVVAGVFILIPFASGSVANDIIGGSGDVIRSVDDDIARGMGTLATKSNYRSLFLEKFPDLPSGWQVHHTLPQKYDDIMKSAGTNIHEVQYLKGIDPKIHSKITTEWGKWDKTLGRTPTADDVINFAKTINEKYGKYWFNK